MACSPFLYCVENLNLARQQLAAGLHRGALLRLIGEADEALAHAPWTVMDKPVAPASGNKHDYMSVGVYWWPNPNTSDGLPYVWRDGEINPDFYKSDGTTIRELALATETLALAYALQGDDRYSDHAALLLRTWFLNEATRMTPHMLYAQGIPGHCTGRGIGLIDASQTLPYLANAACLLNGCAAWTEEDDTQLRAWMAEFLDWLLTSDFGKEEREEANNHGTWFDVLVCSLAFYTGNDDIARGVLEEAAEKRIAPHIEPDGSQPGELKRTCALTYTIFNLTGFFHLARFGERFGLDLWRYESPRGGSVRGALDWLTPYANPETPWPYQQITPTKHYPALWMAVRQAGVVYDDCVYEEQLDWLGDLVEAERFWLTWPLH